MAKPFAQLLTVNVQVYIEDVPFEVEPSTITAIEWNLYSYGFDAMVEFKVTQQGLTDPDLMYEPFTTQAVNKVSLEVLIAELEIQEPLALFGVVTTKSIEEEVPDEAAEATITRTYRLHFKDSAAVLWTQHFPTQLYPEAVLSEVIELNTVEGVELVPDWPLLEVPNDFVFLPLGTRDNEASFYDFLMWYSRIYAGVFTYNYDEVVYSLNEFKISDSVPMEMEWADIGKVEVVFPEFPRYSAEVINASADSPITLEVPNLFGAIGVTKSMLVRSEIPTVATEQEALEELKLGIREAEVHITLRNYPIVPLVPGTMVSFVGQTKISIHSYISEEIMRVRRFHFKAVAGGSADLAEAFGYSVEAVVVLESVEDTYVPLPPFKIPRWPAYVEGRVLSLIGEPLAQSWEFDVDPESLSQTYTVLVPTFEDIPIPVPFIPNTLPGHFFYPAVKDQKVLLAMDFTSAQIVSYLDWRLGAQQLIEGQGNAVLMGNVDLLDSTAIIHQYTPEQNPEFLVRRNHDVDIQEIKLSEGTLTLWAFNPGEAEPDPT